MSEMETELGRLLNAVIGEPPHSVSVSAVRRRADRTARRRVVTGVAATAALVAATASVAISASAIGTSTAVSAGHAGRPAGLLLRPGRSRAQG